MCLRRLVNCIVPPFLLHKLLENSDADIRESAMRTLVATAGLRGVRQARPARRRTKRPPMEQVPNLTQVRNHSDVLRTPPPSRQPAIPTTHRRSPISGNFLLTIRRTVPAGLSSCEPYLRQALAEGVEVTDFERALKRLIEDKTYRDAVADDWTHLTDDHKELDPPELLLLMQVWAATGDERTRLSAITLCHCCCGE